MVIKNQGFFIGCFILGLIGISLSLNGVLANTKAEEQKFISLGTGGVTGVYYPAGGAICSLVNRSSKEHKIRCSAETSSGSEYNLLALKAQELDFGLVQSDVHFNFYKGKEQFANLGAFTNLRSVFSLHAEALTLVARQEIDGHKFSDLKNRRVNLGNEGSGQRATIELLLKTLKVDSNYFAAATNLRAPDMANALCSGKLDAINFVVGHPNSSIKEATNSCKSKILEVDEPLINKVIASHPYYSRAVIPGGEYANNPNPINTLGVVATFVTNATTSEEVVYKVVKSVFENFETFKKRHPAFANLTKESMVKDGLTAPLHPGALKYYREAGLIK